MVRFLAKVVETFQLSRGLTVATDITSDREFRDEHYFELRRPDGSTLFAEGSLNHFSPSVGRPMCFTFPKLYTSDTPVGTELWLLTEEEMRKRIASSNSTIS